MKAAYDTLKHMQISSWQEDLRLAIKDPLELLKALQLPATDLVLPTHSVAGFPVRVPPAFLQKIQFNDISDPLLRQVFPLPEEDGELPGFSNDPLQEVYQTTVPGVLHKYYGRVLLITTGACAIHCRYCFRRHYPYTDNNPGRENWRAALDYIQANTDVTEVILSGGDPLVLADQNLAFLVERLSRINHLQRLRLHTRIPVVLPSRVSQELVSILTGTRLKPVVVIHSNHPNELDDQAGVTLARLHDAGITLLNQAVLLKGINDDAETQCRLSEKLFACNVLPYYLHQLDKVNGTGHFLVDDVTARSLMTALRKRLPGYLVPRLVREVPGIPYKTPLL